MSFGEGGGGVIKRVKLPTPSSSAICYEMQTVFGFPFTSTVGCFPSRCSCRYDLSKDGCSCCCKGATEAARYIGRCYGTKSINWCLSCMTSRTEHSIAEGHCWKPREPRPSSLASHGLVSPHETCIPRKKERRLKNSKRERRTWFPSSARGGLDHCWREAYR